MTATTRTVTHLRDALQTAISERHELHRRPVRVRVVEAGPLPPAAAALPATAAPASAPAGRAAPVGQVRDERPDVNVLDAAAAEEAVPLSPLPAVRAGADDRGGAEALELSVGVGVGADEAVQVDAARIQARLLRKKYKKGC